MKTNGEYGCHWKHTPNVQQWKTAEPPRDDRQRDSFGVLPRDEPVDLFELFGLDEPEDVQ